MDPSGNLLSAQVHFLILSLTYLEDAELALIHIPLSVYHAFVRPILEVIISWTSRTDSSPHRESELHSNDQSRRDIDDAHFINVSVTPLECSVACSRSIINELFLPLIETLDQASREKVVITSDDYVVIQVDGEGEALEAGKRVVELTAPLALNGIPLFFITTYFSDYILVPVSSRAALVSALKDRGFVFEQNSESFVNISSPLLSAHSRTPSTALPPVFEDNNPFDAALSVYDGPKPPPTPPPSSVAELETRTFKLLTRHGITANVDPSLLLVQCAARRESSMRITVASPTPTATTKMRMRFQLGLVRCLIRQPRPRFFSITLADGEDASLLMEKDLLSEFDDGRGLGSSESDPDAPLLGSKDTLVPITFDLRELPMESTGIVCGVAGRLVGGMRSRPESSEGGVMVKKAPVEMSYLSTARAGTVMVAGEDLGVALEALERESGYEEGGGGMSGGSAAGVGLGLGMGMGPPSRPIPIRNQSQRYSSGH